MGGMRFQSGCAAKQIPLDKGHRGMDCNGPADREHGGRRAKWRKWRWSLFAPTAPEAVDLPHPASELNNLADDLGGTKDVCAANSKCMAEMATMLDAMKSKGRIHP